MLLTAAPAFAQKASLPGFSVPSVQQQPALPLDNFKTDSFANYDMAFLRFKNPILADTLKLQYQISLLKIMLKRQAEIDRISASYKELGIAFKQPAPEKTTCKRLPKNLLCLLFYPDIFGIDPETYRAEQQQEQFDSSLMDFMTPQQDISNDNAPVANNTPSQPVQPAPEEDEGSPYLWTDIQCVARSCRAVLMNTKKAGQRMTVRMGEVLPDESVVHEISYAVVRLKKEKEILDIEPAPLGELTGLEQAASSGQIGNILRDRGLFPSEDESSSSASDSAQEPQGPTISTPDEALTSEPAEAPSVEPAMLGPTGLF